LLKLKNNEKIFSLVFFSLKEYLTLMSTKEKKTLRYVFVPREFRHLSAVFFFSCFRLAIQ